MYCSKCGKKIKDDSVFCSYCGAKVIPLAVKMGDSSSIGTQEEPQEKDEINLDLTIPDAVESSNNGTQETELGHENDEEEKKPSNQRNGCLLWIGFFVVFAVIRSLGNLVAEGDLNVNPRVEYTVPGIFTAVIVAYILWYYTGYKDISSVTKKIAGIILLVASVIWGVEGAVGCGIFFYVVYRLSNSR